VTVDDLSLTLVADHRHSVPVRVRLEADEGAGMVPVAAWDLPPIVDGDDPGATVTLPLELSRSVTSTRWTLVVEDVRQEPTRDWYSSGLTLLPVAIAEVGIPGISVSPPPPDFESGCRDDLLAIDDQPVPVRVSGTTDDALDRRPLDVVACDPGETIEIDAGEHTVRTGVGRDLGIDIDRLAFGSEAGGGSFDPDLLPRTVPTGPPLEITHDGKVSWDATVDVARSPFWLVMGQSLNAGFQAQVADADLGAPVLVQGYANGWHVDPAAMGAAPGPQPVSVTWAPQRILWIAIAVSAFAVLITLVIAVRRRPATIDLHVAEPRPPSLTWPPLPIGARLSRRSGFVFGTGGLAAAVLLLPTQGHLAAIPVVAGVAYMTARHPRGRSLALAGAAVALGLSAAFVGIQQIRHRFPPDFSWPAQFEIANGLGMVALLLLAVQAARDAVAAHTDGETAPQADAPARDDDARA
jgi:arabinofuranan 3-O-arabinosyltransferase